MRFESRLFQGSLAGGVDSYPQKFIVTGLPIRLLALGLVCRGLQNLVAVRLRLTLVFKVFHRFFQCFAQMGIRPFLIGCDGKLSWIGCGIRGRRKKHVQLLVELVPRGSR